MLASREFATDLVNEGHTASEEKLHAELAANPLTFEGAEKTQAGDVPVELLQPSDLGAIYDDAAKHVLRPGLGRDRLGASAGQGDSTAARNAA